ncbi:MAG: O-antigen ligase family protein [Planctomycetota bacterium]|nr:O-antigen ligase family protein [Planctomycetota bacterium]
MRELNHEPILTTDFNSKTSLWRGLALVLVGWLVAFFVKNDGIFSRRIQIDILGPNPAFVNDIPYFGSVLLIVVGLLLIFIVGLAIKSGSIDRVVLGMLALSLNADVIPMLFQLSVVGFSYILVDRGLRQRRIPFRLTPMVVFMGLMILSYAVSFLQNPEPLSLISNLLYRSTYLILVILLPALLVSRRHLDTLFDFMLVAAMLTVGVEIAQYILSAMSGSIITFSTSGYNSVVTPFGTIPRLTGLMYHPNHQSNILATQGIMALWFSLQPKGTLNRRRRMFLFAGYIILAFGTVITMSRSGWLSIAVATVLVPLIRFNKIAPWYFVTLVGLGLLAYTTGLGEASYKVIHDINGASADFRWHIDDIALEAFFTRPWFGVGTSNLLDFFNPYQLEVHDTYLQIASGMGLFGILVFGGYILTTIIRLINVVLNPASPAYRDWAIALLFGLMITAIQSFFAMFLWIKFLWGVFGIAESVIMNNSDKKTHQSANDFIFLPPQR